MKVTKAKSTAWYPAFMLFIVMYLNKQLVKKQFLGRNRKYSLKYNICNFDAKK